ncbi:TetR/AcrR family transcriptional regulator [Lachnospiraceae bacterium 29-84]
MDIREKKTKRSIKNAFLQLRASKPLEKITIKELSTLAEISKATFYLHYKDIYDLSDTLEKEVIQLVLNDIKKPDIIFSDVRQFINELALAFYSQTNIIEILFSGSQQSILPICIEKELKQYIFQIKPELKDDIKFNIALSYQIQGSYYAFSENHKQFGANYVLSTLSELHTPLFNVKKTET